MILGLAPQDPPVGVGRVPAEVAAQRRALPRLRAVPKLQKVSVRLRIRFIQFYQGGLIYSFTMWLAPPAYFIKLMIYMY